MLHGEALSIGCKVHSSIIDNKHDSKQLYDVLLRIDQTCNLSTKLLCLESMHAGMLALCLSVDRALHIIIKNCYK